MQSFIGILKEALTNHSDLSAHAKRKVRFPNFLIESIVIAIDFGGATVKDGGNVDIAWSICRPCTSNALWGFSDFADDR